MTTDDRLSKLEKDNKELLISNDDLRKRLSTLEAANSVMTVRIINALERDKK